MMAWGDDDPIVSAPRDGALFNSDHQQSVSNSRRKGKAVAGRRASASSAEPNAPQHAERLARPPRKKR